VNTQFDIAAVLFTLVGLLGLPRLARGWRALVAPDPSAEGEALALYVAIFLAVPLATLAHELGHLLTAQSLGARDATLHYRIFWGYVTYAGGLSPRGDWWVALAGNAVSWALAVGGFLLYHTRLPPGLRSAARIFGMAEMIHTLVAYPLMSLGSLPGADWTVIYGRPFWRGTWVVASLHAASLYGLRRELRSPAAQPEPPIPQPEESPSVSPPDGPPAPADATPPLSEGPIA
jgi:hypothetical protein